MKILPSTSKRQVLFVFFFSLFAALAYGQEEKELAPVSRTYAITNVNIVQAPGRKIEMGTLLIKDGLITAVGKGIPVTTDAIVIKADSMYVYAGFIDGLSRVGVIRPKEEAKDRVKDPGNPPADRAGITPQNEVRSMLNPSDKSIEELRALGFTVAQVVPYGNPLPGHASIILLGGKTPDNMILSNNSALYAELAGASGMYPATVMGVMAKWRDLYRNATLSKSYEVAYNSNKVGLMRPASDRILEAFYPVIDQKIPVLFKSERMLETQRVFSLKNELNFPLVIGDLKEGWPIVAKVKASGAKVFLSLDLPEDKKKEEAKKDEKKKDEPAKVKSEADVEKETLAKRKDEAVANYTAQAASFSKAGVTFGFSSLSAKTKDIQSNLRRMIAGGLTEDAALAALTTMPAQLLGLSDRLGTIDNGKMANLVISDKPYFNEKAKVKYVFVDGTMYKLEAKESKKSDGKVTAIGSWSYTVESPQGGGGTMNIKESGGVLSGTIVNKNSGKESEMKDLSLDGNTLTFSYGFETGSSTIQVKVTATIDGDSMEGTMAVGQYGSFPMKANREPKK